MFSDLKWRLIYLVTGECPAPRTTSVERVEIFKELVREGFPVDEAFQDLAYLRSEEMSAPSPPWA